MRNLSLARRFLIGSLVILLVGMTGIGLWVTRQIENGVVHRTASTTAVYVDSLIAPSVQDLASSDQISDASEKRLTWLLTETPLGQQLALFRIWDRAGNVVYSSITGQAGTPVEMDDDFKPALEGKVSAHIGEAEAVGGSTLPVPSGNLLEIYSPVRKTGTDEVIGVAEFYYATDSLSSDLSRAQRQSWMVVGGVAIAIYLLLAVFVQRASNTIDNQQVDLSDKVVRLTDLLEQNEELSDRVRAAATLTTSLNERVLRRLSADLHDGPAQDMSFALLQLDNVQAAIGTGEPVSTATEADLEAVRASLKRALEEIRATSGGLVLPQLEALTLAQVVDLAVRSHRRRSGTTVELTISPLIPAAGPVSVKIALYRLIQEGLTNAWRHAGGIGQRVDVTGSNSAIHLVIADRGPGFDVTGIDTAEHLGIIGMCERVESLGGVFRITSTSGTGTEISVDISLNEELDTNG